MNITIKQPQQLMGGGGGIGGGPRPVAKKPGTGGKLMRLRCRFRPLHDNYLVENEITEKDSDVVFLCSDGRVRAHKIILASSSQFFASLFDGQLPGIMTSVLVPDIPVTTVRIILSLAYKDNTNLTPQQMKDVSPYLKLFGFPAKLFSYDGNPLRQPASAVRTIPVTVPMNSGTSGGNVRIVNQPGPSGMGSNKGIGPSGAVTVTASSIYRDVKAQQQRQQLAAAQQRQRVDAEGDLGYEQQQLLTAKMLQQQQRLGNAQIRKVITASGEVIVRQGPSGGQPGQRRVFPKSPLRRIAPKPTPGSMPVETTFANPTGQQQVQIETEMEQGDDDEPIDSEQGRLIQQWMRNVGRDDKSEQFESSDGDGLKNQCMICNNVFDNEEKWRWHETHHVGLGLFKCAYCDELFSTSRKVYQHEMMEHGVTSAIGATDSPSIPPDFQIVQGRKRRGMEDEYEVAHNSMLEGDEDPPKMTLVRTIHGSHYRRLPGTAGPVVSRTKKYLAAASGSLQLQQKYAKYASLARNFKARNPLIGIAKTDAEDLLESRKVKQLHWLYICSKCENASDSSAKAQEHFLQCYSELERSTVEFESCVVKYRQGFFGKFQCPLCPKRYTSIGGFTIHCGHIHNDYRRKFAHRHEDETMCCMICKKKYKDPAEFHAHLSDDAECTGTPVFGPEDLISNEWIGNGTPGEDSSPPKRINLGTLSRSTRLANRILTVAQDETSFNPVDCPICGASKIPKIVDHLQSEHADLNIQVLRVADTTLRCQKCSISFALCDLLAHHGSCTGSKEFQFGRVRSRASAGPPNPLPIPPGVGCSPIDTIECQDLSTIETLKAALKCNVCGRTASKLGTIAECYRTHGIVRCALCFNTYLDRSSYSIHLKSTHAASVANKLRCPLCDKEFTNVGQTAGHMYNNHWLTLLGGPVNRKGPRKFLPNQFNFDDLESTAEPSAEGELEVEGEEGEVEGELEAENLQEDLEAPGENEEKPGTSTNDDYSNITLGSLLESSTVANNSPASKSASATGSAGKTNEADAKSEEQITTSPGLGLEDLLNNDKSGASSGAASEGDGNNEMVDEEEEPSTEDDERLEDSKPEDVDGEGLGQEEFEDANYEEAAEEEEDGMDENGMNMNVDDDELEVFPGGDEDDEMVEN